SLDGFLAVRGLNHDTLPDWFCPILGGSCGAGKALVQPASSRERLVAAATARFRSCSKPSLPMRISSAAAVVPLGEVTFSRKLEGSRDERRSNSPEPAIVSRASFIASVAGKPAPTPAFASASASRKI